MGTVLRQEEVSIEKIRVVPERTIIFIIDGMPCGIEDKISLPYFSKLKNEGVFYREVYLPLPAHPEYSKDYQWTCSIPNPVMMSGTVFIGQKEINQNFIQHSFRNRPSAFYVNAWTYSAISNGFTYYEDCSDHKMEMVFRDEIPIERAKEAIEKYNPEFIRIHCQGPGSAGHRSHREAGRSFTNNIWSKDSPFVLQNKYTDRLLGEFVEWLITKKLWDETVLIVMGDHGQCDYGGHPPYEPGGYTTQLLVAGKNIKKGIVYDYAEIIDIAPTIAWLHNVPQPKFSNGRVLNEIMIGEPAPKKVNQLMKNLDAALLDAHMMNFLKRSNEYLDISKIGLWHTGKSKNNYLAFVSEQVRMVEQYKK